MILLIVIKPNVLNIKPSAFTIKAHKFIRFIKVGNFLHFMAILGLIVFFVGLQKSIYFFKIDNVFYAYLWLFISLYGFTIPFFSEFDAYGRYQNYKQIKDSFNKMGYDARLVKPFMYSKCQRDAVLVAAADLNCKNEVQNLFYKEGYRWYHILPDAFMNNPKVLFKKVFWTRILFTKYYQLQNFYG